MHQSHISAYDFSTLYRKLPHDKLKSKLSSIVDFGFERRAQNFYILCNDRPACWEKKIRGGLGFSKTSLKIAINHLIENCYFDVENVTRKQSIDIPMGINPVSFWANLFRTFPM